MQEFITYKNSKIAFSSYGSGNAIVFLHGFLEDSSMWDEVVSEISGKRIVTIDLLGHGNSDCIGYVHTMEDMAEAVKSVLSYLKIRRAIFIGHSMGGYVALAFAEKYTRIVKKLCLMNSTASADDNRRRDLRDRAILMAKQNYKSLVSMSITNLFALALREELFVEIEKCKQQALNVSVQGYIAATEGMKLRTGKEHILQSKDFDILYLIGEKDPVLDASFVVDQAIKNGVDYRLFSNGHMSHLENKKELIQSLKEFLR